TASSAGARRAVGVHPPALPARCGIRRLRGARDALDAGPVDGVLTRNAGSEKLAGAPPARFRAFRTGRDRRCAYCRKYCGTRVAVIGGGCSGLQYKMDLVDGPANRDIMVESQNVRVVVDPKSALFVSGSLLDFSDDLQKGGFKVTNPNAVAHCSCGESFSA